MKLASLGSGSSGNATLIASAKTTVIVDCGFGLKDTEQRLARMGVNPLEVHALLVTHEHSDHAKGVGPFARKYKLPVFMTEGTWLSRDMGRIPSLHKIRDGEAFTVGDLSITPVAVPHDAREPVQYTFCCGEKKCGVITDLGSVTPHVVEAFSGCHGLLVEANHDLDMLARGPYPPSLKARVASHWGHLNNIQTANLLGQLLCPELQTVVIGHISQKNNSIECAKLALKEVTDQIEQVYYANQDEGIAWVVLED
ncbi:MBL fold metallo-hydrolase [Teredinibacter sp. KSP-S5-2]|uniref:MBL fold metallo-hydrolase n=1 Tax=Teredinibacter sp. KSP-S5-2 TaxID=3034506 RepID=UPI002934C993|nr:MBL fold metallo-hydrolase [Teredinibacter sp. KSP-S5-2]WNO09810.1 MBL fold metallo-hydrolase [Teredinibacter sp. KSP-S5-2]